MKPAALFNKELTNKLQCVIERQITDLIKNMNLIKYDIFTVKKIWFEKICSSSFIFSKRLKPRIPPIDSFYCIDKRAFLKATIILLSTTYKCQFFIFDCLNRSTQLFYMYPSKYDDTLRPVYFYRPKYDSSHVIFIRSIDAFFKANSYICLACLRQFKRMRDSRSPHLCKKKSTCFACRRFYSKSNNYLNSSLTNEFCDRFNTAEQSFNCSILTVCVY